MSSDPTSPRSAELVDRALGEDPLADARRRTKRYALGDLPNGPMHAFNENVERICEHAGSDAERIRNTFMFSPAEITAQRGTERSSMRDALRRLTGVRGSDRTWLTDRLDRRSPSSSRCSTRVDESTPASAACAISR